LPGLLDRIKIRRILKDAENPRTNPVEANLTKTLGRVFGGIIPEKDDKTNLIY
jgi:hypothetical protein